MKQGLIVCLVIAFTLLLSACSRSDYIRIEDDATMTSNSISENQVTDQTIEVTQKQDQLHVMVFTDTLNIRSNSTTESEIIGKARMGDVYKVLDKQLNDEDQLWIKISTTNNMQGWIASWYTSLLSTHIYEKLSQDNLKSVVATEDIVNVFQECSQDSAIVSKIYKNDLLDIVEVKMIQKNNTWFKIRTRNGITGWIASTYTRKRVPSELKVSTYDLIPMTTDFNENRSPDNYYLYVSGICAENNSIYYILHAYESVKFEDGSGHSATLGWYHLSAENYENIGLDSMIDMFETNDTEKHVNKKDILCYELYDNSDYAWLIDYEKNMLYKINLKTVELLREINISDTFIEGKVIALEEDMSINTLSDVYVATINEGTYQIYKSITSDRFNMVLHEDLSGKPFDEISKYSLRDIIYEINSNKEAADRWIDLSLDR